MNSEKFTEKWLPKIISWGLSLYLMFLFATSNYINHRNIIQERHIYLFTSIFLALFPFLSEIRIGNFLELKKIAKETKEEVQEHKREVRNLLSIMTTNFNALSVGNLNNSITFQQPVDSLASLENLSSQENVTDAKEIKEEILSIENEDIIMALAKTRIVLERSLRYILEKQLTTKNADKDIKYASIGKLISIFLTEFKSLESLRGSFDYVRKISNSAIHGQNVPPDQAEEALDAGAKLIAFLEDFQSYNNY